MYTIVLAGSDIGAPEAGTGAGPDYILKNLQLDQLDSINKVIRIPVDHVHLERGSNDETLNFLVDLNSSIKKHVEAVLLKGDVPLVFHGDDSLIIGTGMALLDSGIKPGLLYFDAHGDINIPKTSLSGCLFGMGVAHLMGLGFNSVLEINNAVHWLRPEHIRFVGTRNLDPGERDFIIEKEIKIIDVQKVRTNLQASCEALLVAGVEDIYIHIDQDVVDPNLSGASLCREPNGLFPEELYAMLRFARDNFNIKAISFGNYKPDLDTDHKTINIIKNCLNILAVV